MIRSYFILLFLTFSVTGCSQQKVTNYSFFKLMVVNSQTEILLVNWKGNWEIPGSKYRGSESITDFTDKMASQMGITVGQKRLAGLFTFHYSNKPNPTLMHYYNAMYVSGKLKPQPGTSDAKWFTINEALEIIPYSDMVEIIKQINKNPTKTLGAAFDISKKTTNSPRSHKLQSDFYFLN